MSAPGNSITRNAPLRAAAVTAVLVAAAILSCFHISNLDIGGHIAVGRETLKTGQIPDTDFFTHTVTGSPYPVHQWLGEVVVFGVDYLGGTPGLVLLRMLIVVAGAVLLYRNARRENAPVAVATAIVLLLIVAARPRFLMRPMLASLVFLPLLQGWLAEYRSGRSTRLWPVLVLMPVWGHIHSGVLFGVLMLGGTLFAEGIKQVRRTAAIGPAAFRRLGLFSAVAVALPFATMALVNPSGLKPLILPFLFFRNQSFRTMIGEYRPVDLLVDWPFDVVAIAVVLGILLRRKRVDLTDLVIVGGFGILAFQAVRGILPFAAV
ncbi:MAG: hypothetical protein HKN12_04780, partial [Gemmatimonadetes bacterium]|nr:hypothetical protein [Gemmatimonadota bacterium]